MRKKILFSFLAIAVSAAIVIGGTTAFFSDTETSTGNVFTAGSIDLKVDHTVQTYNGVDCKTCDVVIMSDTTNLVTGTVDGDDPVAFPHNAVPVTATWVTDAYWTNAIPGATWIWSTDPVTEHDKNFTVTYTFEKDFIWYGPVNDALLSFGLAADNNYIVYLNGHQIGADNSGGNSASVDTIPSANIAPWIQQGTNTLTFEVTNLGQPNLPAVNNPGGLLYRLEIDGNCGDAYFQNHCKLWEEKDLDEGDILFNFEDVKPGDLGTDVVSLHVYDNDAYTCIYTENNHDDDNTQTEPESLVDDDGLTTGELSKYLNIFTWYDLDGDGVYEPTNLETQIGTIDTYENLFINGNGIAYADSENGKVLAATTTAYIGLTWCAGDLTVSENDGTVNCDPMGMGNITQTDSLKSDVVFYAEQVRNNGSFTCDGLFADTNDNIIVNANNLNGWYEDNLVYPNYNSTGANSTPGGADSIFATGFSTPPLGAGSLHQEVIDGNDGTRMLTDSFNGVDMSTLQFSYDTYVATHVDSQAPYVQLRVDLDGDGDTEDQIYFEPVYQSSTYCSNPQSSLTTGIWQSWNVSAGCWWSANNINSAGPGINVKTLAQYLSGYPNAKLSADVSAIRVQSGFGAPSWDNFSGAFDKVIINGNTYDFEN